MVVGAKTQVDRLRQGVTRSASLPFHLMRLVATDSAVDFIQEHGGRLYIWMKQNRCCGGSYSTLGAGTAAPPKTEFQRVDENVGFELYVPAALLGRLADELHFEVRRLPRASRRTGTAAPPGSFERACSASVAS